MLLINPSVKLIGTIILIIAVAGAVSFVLKDGINSAAKNIYEQRSMLRVLESRDDNYVVLKANYPIVRDSLPVLKKALLDENSIDAIVSSLDAVAAQTQNIQNLEFSPLMPVPGTGPQTINFSVSLVGNIGSFEEYFNKLHKLSYPIEISSININNELGIFNNDSRLSYKAKLYIKK